MLRDRYNRTRIFVVASEFEGVGLPDLEATACAAALVSTRNGGVVAYAGHRSALLTPPRRPVELAAAICRLLGDDQLRHRLAAAGAARAARFTWKASADAFERFLFQHANPVSGGTQGD